MKFNYYLTFAMILIILFSLGTVMASENMTEDTTISNNDMLNPENDYQLQSKTANDEPDNLASEDDSSNKLTINQIDLSVKIDVKTVNEGKKFNCEGFEVPWNITVKVSGGTAQNVRVQNTLSNNMQFLSANPNIGTYDSNRGVWNIGELKSTDTAILTILTKLKSNGTFTTTANVQSGSFDLDSSNNHDSLYIKSGLEDEDGSNITKTTDDSNKADHNQHYTSLKNNGIVKREHKTEVSQKKQKSKDKTSTGKISDSKDKTDDNSKSSNTGSSKLTKSMSMFSKTLTDAYKSIENTIDSNPKEDDADSKSNSSDDFEIIPAHDYTRIPIIILTVFLVLLAVIAVYDKVKS